ASWSRPDDPPRDRVARWGSLGGDPRRRGPRPAFDEVLRMSRSTSDDGGEGRHRPSSDLSSSAQEYLLTLRIMAGDGSRITASQVARKLGVSTQAASEMFRRLAADGLVTLAEGRELQLTKPG